MDTFLSKFQISLKNMNLRIFLRFFLTQVALVIDIEGSLTKVCITGLNSVLVSFKQALRKKVFRSL